MAVDDRFHPSGCPDRRNRDEAGDPDLALAGEVYGARRYDHGSAPGQYPMLGPNALGEDQGSIPDPAEDEGAAAAPPCFLCASGERCARSQLVGALRDVELAHEDHGGRARALLDVAGREMWLELAPPWQSLAPTLQDVLAAGLHVRLAGYHLARGAVGERPGYRAAEHSLVPLGLMRFLATGTIASTRISRASKSEIQSIKCQTNPKHQSTKAPKLK